MVALIDGARESLLLKQFKLQSEAIEQALLRAHQRGVQVRVMLNPHTSGGDRWNDEAHGRLGEWGIEVAWTSEAFPVTHEKSMVVDRSCALISTFNLSDKYFTETRDYGIVSHAPPVVEEVIAGFEADWARTFSIPTSTWAWFGAVCTAAARWPESLIWREKPFGFSIPNSWMR